MGLNGQRIIPSSDRGWICWLAGRVLTRRSPLNMTLTKLLATLPSNVTILCLWPVSTDRGLTCMSQHPNRKRSVTREVSHRRTVTCSHLSDQLLAHRACCGDHARQGRRAVSLGAGADQADPGDCCWLPTRTTYVDTWSCTTSGILRQLTMFLFVADFGNVTPN